MSEQRAEGFWWVRWGDDWQVAWHGAGRLSQVGNALYWPAERVLEWGMYLGRSPEETAAEVRANMEGLTTKPGSWPPPSDKPRRLPPGLK